MPGGAACLTAGRRLHAMMEVPVPPQWDAGTGGGPGAAAPSISVSHEYSWLSVMTCSVIGSNISNDIAGIKPLHIHVVEQYFLMVLCGFFHFFFVFLYFFSWGKGKMYSKAAGVPGATINCTSYRAPVKIRQIIWLFFLQSLWLIIYVNHKRLRGV